MFMLEVTITNRASSHIASLPSLPQSPQNTIIMAQSLDL